MHLTDATIADFFCKGIETSVLLPEQARAWSDTVIAESAEPTYAMFEVSLNKDIPDIIAALRAVPGDRDTTRVGSWLLGELLRLDVESVTGLAAAIGRARLISRHCGMADDVDNELDGIDDSLDLARHRQYGTVDGCRREFLACLSRYARQFPGAAEVHPSAPADGLRPSLR